MKVTAIGNPADNGFLMFLSPDLKSSLATTMNRNCALGVNTQCYGAVIDVLEAHDVILQARSLEQRHVEHRGLDLIVSGALAGIAALLYPLFFYGRNREVLQPLVIPPAQLWEELSMEEATAIIIVNTASQTTITAPPERATPTGLVTSFLTKGSAFMPMRCICWNNVMSSIGGSI